MNLRERHSHTFKDPHRTERCDAATLLAAGDALVEMLEVAHLMHQLDGCGPVCKARDALSAWKKATDG